ncbi:Pimeloyl-ACP methyl ester carboxylesterase [Devosia lucknowensis]|uniref:Pimeloyl-ACP methyl ester carboxylesterase n=1 Tax=Devosia lucknowensis TaxID=1096929 RepID=A0A1Y6FP54_9HYPH|nr:alpha/beta hydrolase [Devosia lucknowensis]SMQ74622.1 Pimeloyl-ACP methyl ester carboxylesterase [Devosia lucknowensis]
MIRTLIAAATLVAAGPALAQSAPQGDYSSVNGMEMYYEVSGEGEPLIVLHGAYMNIPAMGDIIARLAETHKVYALETQGHGRTNDIDRPITYPNMAGDVAAFMDAVGIEKADVFGYSMGAATGLKLAIDHPEKVDQLVAASVSFDMQGGQPEFLAMIPSMAPEMFVGTPMEDAWKALSPDPDGFRPFVERMIALEHEPMAWGEAVAKLEVPVLIIAGDADMMTLEHLVEMFKLLGGGMAGDMGKPLSASRLAILPATSHTAVINQTDLLMGFIDPFLAGETPKGMFD